MADDSKPADGGGEPQRSVDHADPLAGRTGWDPICRTGANFRTRRLVARTAEEVAFVPTLGLWVFVHGFFLMGAFVLVLAGFALTAGGEGQPMIVLFPSILGILLIGAGVIMRRRLFRPLLFDRRAGIFRTRDAGEERAGKGGRGNPPTPLERIRALQLLRQLMDKGGGGYYSYEINLVLDDATRRNVIGHGKLEALRRDAQRLGEFLKVPVWDETRG